MTQVLDFPSSDRFELRRELGVGGMGVVYEAHDRELDRRVALKTLRNLDENTLYLFKNEFRSLCSIRHPNLVQLFELQCISNFWFFTMEYVDGEDFRQFVRPGPLLDDSLADLETSDGYSLDGPAPPARDALPSAGFDEGRLRRALMQLVRGVAALHRAGKIHRDLKPTNVLVTRSDERPVILDFGLVADVRAVHDLSERRIVGTAHYMSPEQAAGKPIAPASDWYAVGVMLYEALTGRLPFDGHPLFVLQSKQRASAPAPSSLVAEIPSDLESLCRDLLAINPGERPDEQEILHRLGFDGGVSTFSSAARLDVSLPSLVGRGAEIEQLEEAYRDARRGSPAVVLVEGPSGVGKTALTQAFLGSLGSSVVLEGRCYERETVPYKAVDSVVDSLVRFLRRDDPRRRDYPPGTLALAQVFPIVRRLPHLVGTAEASALPLNPLEQRNRAFAALRALIDEVARTRGLVLFIDDIHWTDLDSVVLLQEILRGPAAPPLLLVLAARPLTRADAGEPTNPLSRLLSAFDVRRIELANLDEEETTQLVSRYLERAETRLDAETIVRESAGHPMLALELARYLADTQALGSPDTLDSVLWARIGRLPAAERELVELIAIAGAPIPREIIDSVHGGETRAAIASLASQHLLKTTGERRTDLVTPYHDRIQETIVQNVDETVRVALHRRLAIGFLERGADGHAHEVVRHLEAAGETTRAARHAEKAAERARNMLAFDRASALYRTALRLDDANRERRQRLLLDLGSALVNAGRSAEAAEVLLEAARDANAAMALDCRRRAAEQLLGAGHVERGLGVIRDVLAEIGESIPAGGATVAKFLWQRARLRLRGLSWKERDPSQVRPDELSRLDIYQTVAVLGNIDPVVGAYFQAKAFRVALRIGERKRLARSMGFEAVYVAALGGRAGIGRAEALVGEIRRMADREQDPYVRALAAGTAGIVNMYGYGRFGIAARQLREAEELFVSETIGSHLELSNLRLFRLLALRYLGEYRELSSLLHQYLDDAERRGDRFTQTTLTRASNVAWLVDGKPHEARGALEHWSWLPPTGRLHVQHWYELLALVELALYEGDVSDWQAKLGERFRAFERSGLFRLQMARSAARWLKARLYLAESCHQADPWSSHRRVRRLIAQIKSEKVPYVAVPCHLLEAALAAQAGETELAIASLQAAIQLSEAEERRFYTAAAEMRLADLVGEREGQSIRARALARIEGDAIAEPGAMFDVVAPGFPGARRS